MKLLPVTQLLKSLPTGRQALMAETITKACFFNRMCYEWCNSGWSFESFVKREFEALSE